MQTAAGSKDLPQVDHGVRGDPLPWEQRRNSWRVAGDGLARHAADGVIEPRRGVVGLAGEGEVGIQPAGAADAGDVADWAFSVVDKGVITFEELAGSLGRAAAMSKTALTPVPAAVVAVSRTAVAACAAVR